MGIKSFNGSIKNVFFNYKRYHDVVLNNRPLISPEFNYVLSNDGSYYRVNIGSQGEVTVPATFNGKPILDIAGNSSLTRVTFLGNHCYVPSQGFYGCKKLEEVYMGSVCSMGYQAFEGCTNLSKVNSTISTLSERAFCGCASLDTIIISNWVASIPANCFLGCGELTVYFEGTEDQWNRLIQGRQTGNDCLTNANVIYGHSHSWDKGELSDPTCLGYGYTSEECRECGVREFTFKEATGHSWGDWETLIPYTEDSSGRLIRKCSECSHTNIEYVPALSDVEFMFTQKKDGTYSVKGGGKLSGYVVIPSEYRGRAVTAIDAYAFEGYKNLLGVVIPDTITTIGDYAFAGSSIVRIDVGKSVASIGERAFYGCEDLYAVYNNSNLFMRIGRTTDGYIAYYAKMLVEGEVATFVSDEYILYEDFLYEYRAGRRNLRAYIGNEETITLPLTDMGGNTYNLFQMRGVKNVIIPEGITSIGDSAFIYCDTITGLVIPSSVTSIGKNAFNGCSNLNIDIATDNTSFYVENGCLIKRDTNEIIFGNANSTIPSTTKQLGGGSFYGNTYFAPIVIPLSVSVIGSSAFGGKPVTVCVECEETNKPEGWADDWCDSNVTVIWGYVEGVSCVHKYSSTIVSPTCIKQGYTLYTCEDCGKTYKDDYVDALQHDWGKSEVIVKPACTANGWRRHTCSKCGDTIISSISALQHDWGEWKYIHPATCEVDGTGEHTCLRCGEIETGVIKAEGHDWDINVTVVPPTCTNRGYTIHTCNSCGEKHIDEYTSALGHQLDGDICTRCNNGKKGVIYYGISAIPEEYDNSFISSLAHRTPSNSHLTSISGKPLKDEYFYYCVPTSFGGCNFVYNSFVGGFSIVKESISYTNAGGYVNTYNIYKSNQANLGTNGEITITIIGTGG